MQDGAFTSSLSVYTRNATLLDLELAIFMYVGRVVTTTLGFEWYLGTSTGTIYYGTSTCIAIDIVTAYISRHLHATDPR